MRGRSAEHELGSTQAVEPQISVKITVERDSDPALHFGMQLPDQVPHEAGESCRRPRDRCLWTGSR